MNILGNIFNYLQNAIKNGLGVERDLYQLIQDRDISRAKQIFQDRDIEVQEAIKEYDPNEHEVMFRRDKPRKGKEPYRVQKLPRSWQRYINEIALFFLLAKPIVWKSLNEIEVKEESGVKSQVADEAFEAFKNFLKETRFNTTMRQAKRKAGAETESAKVYHLYRDEANKPKVKVLVISASDGYTLRPLFDQYRNLIAFGYGYFLKEGNTTVEHFDILTTGMIYRCKKSGIGWEVDVVVNPTGKINVIYYQQPKEWDGAEQRIARDEEVDSKAGDTNNYFADPIAKVTADVLNSMPDQETSGKLVQMQGKDSVFEYVLPPTSTEMKDGEKKVLRESIHQDTFTPDFSFEAMIGRGDLSGDAIKRAMILGYIKRDNRLETYDELVDREKNLILSIMMNVTHIQLRDKLSKLKLEHDFAEPFDEDKYTEWSAIGKAFTDGIISLETAVKLMGVSDPISEIERINSDKLVTEELLYRPIGGES
nr:MAG TPA: portal protein [Caudoviricetes sp.]